MEWYLESDESTKSLKISYCKSHLRFVIRIFIQIRMQLMQNSSQLLIRVSLNWQSLSHRQHLTNVKRWKDSIFFQNGNTQLHTQTQLWKRDQWDIPWTRKGDQNPIWEEPVLRAHQGCRKSRTWGRPHWRPRRKDPNRGYLSKARRKGPPRWIQTRNWARGVWQPRRRDQGDPNRSSWRSNGVSEDCRESPPLLRRW